MKENYSMTELMEEYKKLSLNGDNLDLEFFTNFFKGINCDKYFFREIAGLELDNPEFERQRYTSLIEAGAQLACLDRDNIMLRSKDKRLKLSTKEYSDGVLNEVVSMYHSTPQGLYMFNVKAYCLNDEVNYVYDFVYNPLEQEKQVNVGVNTPWMFLVEENTIARNKPIEIKSEDISKFANKIYVDGLDVLYERLKKGETIEKISEDRIDYESENKEIIELSEILNLEKQEENKEVEQDNKNGLEIKQVVDVLLYLREKGIELSDEQRNIISLYSDVRSNNSNDNEYDDVDKNSELFEDQKNGKQK